MEEFGDKTQGSQGFDSSPKSGGGMDSKGMLPSSIQ